MRLGDPIKPSPLSEPSPFASFTQRLPAVRFFKRPVVSPLADDRRSLFSQIQSRLIRQAESNGHFAL